MGRAVVPILRLSPKPTIVTGHTKAANKNQGRSLPAVSERPRVLYGIRARVVFHRLFSMYGMAGCLAGSSPQHVFQREDRPSICNFFFFTLVTINDHAREKNYGCTRSSYSEANKSEVDYFSDVSNASLLFVIIPLIDITS